MAESTLNLWMSTDEPAPKTGFPLQTKDKMKDIYKEEILAIPAGVEVEVKARLVTVKGPRGTLHKNFRHVEMDI
ncbi:hypothetical protein BGZ93_004032, partial [Podila epicladia]